jgi:hypothetical protein
MVGLQFVRTGLILYEVGAGQLVGDRLIKRDVTSSATECGNSTVVNRC